MKAFQGIAMCLLSCCVSAPADDRSDRDKLMGAWELQGAADSNPASAWTFAAESHSIRLTETDAGTKVANFECSTEGTPCEVKTGGKKAMVTVYFNGPWLVVLETKGSDVVKRRFRIVAPADASGDQMEMEVIPIVPSGKLETFQYKRTQLSARQ